MKYKVSVKKIDGKEKVYKDYDIDTLKRVKLYGKVQFDNKKKWHNKNYAEGVGMYTPSIYLLYNHIITVLHIYYFYPTNLMK